MSKATDLMSKATDLMSKATNLMSNYHRDKKQVAFRQLLF
jgi:hypothetical protein